MRSFVSKTASGADMIAAVGRYVGRRFILRAEIGDLIIPYGNTVVLSAFGAPALPGTTHNLRTNYGFAFRF